MIYFLVFFVLLTLGLSFVCYNLYSQTVQLEKLYKKQVKKETDIDNFYRFILGLLTRAKLEMDKIDQRGSFSADDEVGFAFRVIQRAIDETVHQMKSIRVEGQNQNNTENESV